MTSPEFVIRLRTASEQANLVVELLAATDLHYSLWDDVDEPTAVFSLYAADAADALIVHESLVAYVSSWERENAPAAPAIVEIAPGMAFGTVLIAKATRIAQWVSDGGDLILSGILTTQFDEVRARYEALGFQLEETSTIDKWRSGCFRAPAVSPPQS